MSVNGSMQRGYILSWSYISIKLRFFFLEYCPYPDPQCLEAQRMVRMLLFTGLWA